MKITIAEVRKLLKELKKKYPRNDCSIDIVFSTWSKEHLSVYVDNNKICTTIHYDNANEIREAYNL